MMVCLVLLMALLAWGAAKLPKKYTETITTKDGTKLSLDMVMIPAGTFTMGSPADEADRADNEGPQHKVKLDAFYMCTTEVTLELFQAFYQESREKAKKMHRGIDHSIVQKKKILISASPPYVYLS